MDLVAQLNTSLAERYRIERLQGEGAMARVFVARDLRHDRLVALKVLNADLGSVLGADRFLTEIRVMAALQHPHLLPLFDSGEADGQLYYVMPFVERETLRARLDREAVLPVDEAVRIAGAVASAVDYAHRHGVIHRDIKPENILLHEGEPLVADFGIALAVSKAGGDRITQSGVSLGTPQYMSPEQATGDRQIDGRTDVYSIAAVLYEMLSGDPPHSGSTLQAVIAKVITERPQSIRTVRESVPEELEAAVMRALAKVPADRFSTAAAFGHAITTAIMPGRIHQPGLPVKAGGAQPDSRRWLPSPHLLRGWGFPIAAGLAAATLGAATMFGLSEESPMTRLRFVIDWSDPGTLTTVGSESIALSPDGSRLARVRGVFPSPLFVRRMGGLNFEPLPGGDTAAGPAFSPDGRWILYAKGPAGQVKNLMVIPADGGAPVKLADSVLTGDYSWGDGNRIVFRRGNDLWIMASSGGAPRLLARHDTSRRRFGLGSPDVLPGGRAALITIEHDRLSIPINQTPVAPDSIYLGVVTIPGGEVKELGIRGVSPRFSRGRLVYTDPAGTLIAIPFDARRHTLSGDTTRLAEGVMVDARGAEVAVARTGMIVYRPARPRAIASAGPPPNFTLASVGRTGVARQTGIVPQAYSSLRASPDGQRIAVMVQRSLETGALGSDIWIIHRATGQSTQLTRDGRSCCPVWSADSKRIHYRVGQASYVAQPWDQSSAPGPVPGTEAALDLAPGDSGGYFAFVRRATDGPAATSLPGEQRLDIWIAPVDTPQAARAFAAASGVDERSPRLSPDGRWLAYEMVTREAAAPGQLAVIRREVFVRPVPGPGPVLHVSGARGLNPMWSVDGRTLYYFDPPNMMAARLAFPNGVATLVRTDRAFQLPPGFVVPNTATTDWADVVAVDRGEEFVFRVRVTPQRAGLPPVALPPSMPRHLVALTGWMAPSATRSAEARRPD